MYNLLTVLLVEYDLQFEFRFALQGFVDLHLVFVQGVWTMQELARTALLHDLGTCKPSKLTKPIRAVDDWVDGWHLGISQHKVAV